MKIKCIIIAGILITFIFQNSLAGLSGTFAVPTDYSTLGDAVTDLNLQGISGNVTINVLAGNPQFAPIGGYSLIVTGTFANQLVINGNGNTVTAFFPQTTGKLNDAIFKIIGGDYITINGFTLIENSNNLNSTALTNNMTEWGIAIFYASTVDGARNIRITNNTISLNKNYVNTFGIYSTNRHSEPAPTVIADITSSNGSNDSLILYSNSISNVNIGIAVIGSNIASFMPTGIDIGGASEIYGNTISNFGNSGTFSAYVSVATSVVEGILISNAINFNISFNTIVSVNAGINSGTLRGIMIDNNGSINPVGTIINSINNNSISLKSAVASGSIQGIYNNFGNSTTTLNINENDFNNITHTLTANGGIQLIIQIKSGLGALNINYNTFTNISSNTSGLFSFITNSGAHAANAVIHVDNNLVVTAFHKTGNGGTLTFYNSTPSSPSSVTETNSNNNFSNITVSGTSAINGWFNIDGTPPGPNKTVTGNIFSNITGGTGSITVMNISYSNSASVSNNLISNINSSGDITGITSVSGTQLIAANTINGLTSSGTNSTVSGIYISGGTQQTVSRNKICNLESNASNGIVNGIRIGGGSIVNVYNNAVGDLRTPSSNAVNALNGISIQNATANSTISIYFNTIYLNAVSSGLNFGSSGLFHTANSTATTVKLDLRNNIIVNNSTPKGTGLAVAFRRSAVTLANYASTSNNNIFYAGNTSLHNLIYYDGTNADSIFSDFKTRMSVRDQQSETENPPFLNTSCADANFLHVNPSVPSFAESGAMVIAGLNDDIDGLNTRINSTPDIGADEFEGTPAVLCTGKPDAGIITGLDSVCPNKGTLLHLAGITSDKGISFKWYSGTSSGGLYSTNLGSDSIQQTGNLNVPTYYIVIVSCLYSGLADTTIEKSIQLYTSPSIVVNPSAGIFCKPGVGVELAAAGGISYSWSPVTGLLPISGSPVVASPTTNTTYTVTGTDIHGCTSVASTLISVSSSISVSNISATPVVVCPGENSVLKAEVGNTIVTANYCIPVYQGGTIAGDYISQVNIISTTLNNTTGAATSSPYYTLFPQSGLTTATLDVNHSSYTMNVKGGSFPNCFVTGWIDFNQDGFFDSGETIGSTFNVGSFFTGFLFVTVPSNAYNGATRLRLRSSELSPGPFPNEFCTAPGVQWGETEDYDIMITGGINKSNFIYEWTSIPNNNTLQQPNINPTTATGITSSTQYNLKATSLSGCESNYNNIYVVVSIPPAITETHTNSCTGFNNGSIDITAIGTAPFTYQWTSDNSCLINADCSFMGAGAQCSNGFCQSTNEDLTNLPPGTYTVVVTDSIGCASGQLSITITESGTLPVFTETHQHPLCYSGSDGSITLSTTETGPFTYLWSSDVSCTSTGDCSFLGDSSACSIGICKSSKKDLSNIPAGTYSVIITNGSGCTSTLTVTLVDPPQIDIRVGVKDTICLEATADALISQFRPTNNYGNYNYFSANRWTYYALGGSGYYTLRSLVQFDLSAIPANATITNATVTFSTCATCSGANKHLNQSNQSNAATLEQITSQWNENSVTWNTAPATTVSNSVSLPSFANNSTTSLVANVTSMVQAMMTGTNYGMQLRLSNEGDYYHALYFASRENTLASIRPQLCITYELDTSTTYTLKCNGDTTASFAITATGTTGPYSGTGVFSQATGEQTYIVQDANGCTKSVTVTVNEPSMPTAHAVLDTLIPCYGECTSVTISGTGGSPNYDGIGKFDICVGPSTFIITDSNGCRDTVDIIVEEPTPLIVTMLADTTVNCHGECVTVTISASGGTPNFQGTGQFTACAGHHTYTVSDANHCSETIELNVSEPPSIPIHSPSDFSICEGSSAILTAILDSGTTAVWKRLPDMNTLPLVSSGVSIDYPMQNTCYLLIVSNASGCSDTDTVCVTVNETFQANAGPDQTICPGSCVTLSTTIAQGTTVEWKKLPLLTTFVQNIPGTVNDCPDQQTCYILIVTNSFGCKDTDTVCVNISSLPIANAGADTTICSGTCVSLNSTLSLGETAIWNRISDHLVLSELFPGISTDCPLQNDCYELLISNALGCLGRDTMCLIVNPLMTVDSIPEQIVCAGLNTTAINFTGTISSTQFKWENSNPLIGLATNGYGNIPSFTAINNSFVDQSATITVTPTSGLKGYAYIPNYNSNDVSIIELETNNIITTIPVGLLPIGVAVSDKRSRVYIVNNGSNSISVINTTTNIVIATIPVGNSPYAVVVNPDGTKVYVTHDNPGKVTVIDATSNTVLTTIPIGLNPRGAVFNPNGTRLYVANQGSNTVSVINTITNLVIANFNTSFLPQALAVNADGSKIYVLHNYSNSINVYNATTFSFINSVGVGSSSSALCLSPDGSKIYVSSFGVNYIYIVSTVSNSVVGLLPTGSGPFGLSLNNEGSRLYISNFNSNSVSVYNTITNTLISTVTVGTNPYAFGNFISNKFCDGVPVQTKITVKPKLIIDPLADQIICSGSCATLTVDLDSGSTAIWKRLPDLALINQTLPGSVNVCPTQNTCYILVVSNSFGCSDTDTVCVNVTPVPIANAGVDFKVCLDSCTILSTVLDSGFTATWKRLPDLIALPEISPGIFKDCQGSNSCYILIVSNSFGCADTDTVCVTIESMQLTNSVVNVNCYNGSDGSITLNASYGTPVYKYAIGDNIPFTTNPSRNNLPAGRWPVACRDTLGCMVHDTVQINQPADIEVELIKNDPTCEGINNGFISVHSSGGTGLHTITISPDVNLIGIVNADNFVFDNLPSGTYTIVVTDQNNCFKTLATTLIPSSTVIAYAGPDQSICGSSCVTLSTTLDPGTTAIWKRLPDYSTITPVSPGVVSVCPNQTTCYILIVSNSFGCADTSTVCVYYTVPPTVDAGPDQHITCAGITPIILHGTSISAGSDISWSPLGSGLILNGGGSLDPTVDGEDCYVLVVTDDVTGCISRDTVCITIGDSVQMSWINSLPELCSGDAPYQLSGALPVGGFYHGNFVDGNGVFHPNPSSLGSNTVFYTYTDSCGYTYTLSKSINVVDCPCDTSMCRDFDDNSIHGWSEYSLASNVVVSLSDSGSQNGTGDYYLKALDLDGPSKFNTGIDFNGRWCCGKFCYDIKLFNDADSNSLLYSQPVFYIMRGEKGFKFTSKIWMSENSGWQRICAPVTNCNPMPVSADGIWEPIVGTNANDWDNVTNHIDAILFEADQFGNAGEVRGFDNVCFVSTPLTVTLIRTSCDTITAVVTGCCGPYSYSWSGGTVVYDSLLTNFTEGTLYSITVYNSTGEYATASITVDHLFANAGPDQVICNGSGTATLHGTTNISGALFIWSPLVSGGILSGQGSPDPVVSGIGCYELTIIDPVSGCIVKDTVCISIGYPPQALWPISFGEVCRNAAPFLLTGGTYSNAIGSGMVILPGTYSGDGVVNGVFHPELAPHKVNTVYYTVTNECGSSVISNTIWVIDCPCDSCHQVSSEQIVNGDFENGNTGFVSGYTHNGNLLPEGRYEIIETPNSVNPGFTNCGDHTNGLGKMMVVNGSASPFTIAFWQEDVTIQKFRNYTFSFYAANVNSSPVNLPQLRVYFTNTAGGFSVFGNVLTSSLFVPIGSSCEWTRFEVKWYSDNYSGPLQLALSDQNQALNGNDFVIDDISFVSCEPFVQASWPISFVPVCSTSPDITLSGGQPSGGYYNGPGVYYNISNGATMFDPGGLLPGTYTLFYIYEDPTSGCKDTARNTISVLAPPLITITAPLAVCKNDPNVIFSASPSGGVFSGSYISSSGIFNPTLAPAGTYTISYTYNYTFQCSITITKIIKVINCGVCGLCSHEGPELVKIPNFGTSAGMIVNYFQTDLKIGGNMCNASGAVQGVCYPNTISTNNCYGSKQIYKTVYDHTTGNGNGRFLLVNGSTSSLKTIWREELSNVQGRVYKFSFWIHTNIGIAKNNNPVLEITIGTKKYPVSYATSSGWVKINLITHIATTNSATVPVIIKQLNNPKNCVYGIDDISYKCCEPNIVLVDEGPDQAILLGENAIITANVSPAGNYKYSWQPGGQTTQSINVHPTVSTAYICTVEDENGCISKGFMLVEVGYGKKAVDNPKCPGGSDGSVSILDWIGTPPFIYSWSNGATTSVVSGLSAGVYYITATDSNGVVTSDSVVIKSPDPIQIVAEQGSTCPGDSSAYINLEITGGTLPYNYQWSNGITGDPFVYNIPAGNYSVVVTDANGCSNNAQQSYVINESISCIGHCCEPGSDLVDYGQFAIDQITDSLSDFENSCICDTSTYCITTNSNLKCNTFNSVTPFSGYANFMAVQGSPTVPNMKIWSGRLNVLSGESYGISTMFYSKLDSTLNSPAFYFVINNAQVYFVDSTTINQFEWSFAGFCYHADTAGEVEISIYQQNTGGAYGMENVLLFHCIPITPPVVTSLPSWNVCKGSNLPMLTVTFTTQYPPGDVWWADGFNGATRLDLSPGLYYYSIEDSVGFITYDSLIIFENSQINLNEQIINTSCVGISDGSIILNVNGGLPPYTYNWSNGAITSAIQSIISGNYSVTVTDNMGCTVTQLFNVSAGILTLFYPDTDGDGFGDNTNGASISTCTAPLGYVSNNSDCDDNNIAVYPGHLEICNTIDDNCNGVIDEGCYSVLNLRVFIQGFYLGGNMMTTLLANLGLNVNPLAVDSVIVELHDPLSTSTIVESSTGILNADGYMQLDYSPAIVGGTYYIVVKHRNSIETWSKIPITFSTVTEFDFTN